MIVYGHLPSGVALRPLTTHQDARGNLTELFRAGTSEFAVPLQWNFVRTNPNTLRGVHVHRDHDDYLIVLSGMMRVGLHDLRAASPTKGVSGLVDISGEKLQSIFVPRGVLHGFYFAGATDYVYGLTNCWTPADDLGCKWDDPALGLPWGAVAPLLSQRDANALSLGQLKEHMKRNGGEM